eukprot:TRINITY_DN67563_c6_g7_i1.p1 TRINITY_DN67563_c6_g7~~TRINITY_DN67563_c6_g7_i1.p1  ORF type:complete len:109 (-),score=0.22 TRINITY_DN67563_c6_g7_i1:40-366(-)
MWRGLFLSEMAGRRGTLDFSGAPPETSRMSQVCKAVWAPFSCFRICFSSLHYERRNIVMHVPMHTWHCNLRIVTLVFVLNKENQVNVCTSPMYNRTSKQASNTKQAQT